MHTTPSEPEMAAILTTVVNRWRDRRTSESLRLQRPHWAATRFGVELNIVTTTTRAREDDPFRLGTSADHKDFIARKQSRKLGSCVDEPDALELQSRTALRSEPLST